MSDRGLETTVAQLVEGALALARRGEALEGRRPGVKNQLGGVSSAPAVGDDVTVGFGTGSMWLQIEGGGRTMWICLDNTTGAAEWSAINNV